mgnify:CR=1 FL=1
MSKETWGKANKEDLCLKDLPAGKAYYELLFQLREQLNAQLEVEKQKLVEAQIQIHKAKNGGAK